MAEFTEEKTEQQEEVERFSRVKEKYERAGQGHIFEILPKIEMKSNLFRQLENLEIEASISHYQTALSCAADTATGASDDTLQPVSDVFKVAEAGKETIQQMEDVGYEAIRAGKVAAVIMSGGQGTRLGYSGPKGMYSIGLLSGKSIFQLHIERLQKVRLLAASSTSAAGMGSSPAEMNVSLPVFIMTSDVNDEIIQNYFKENNYFGYPVNQIFFFEQGLEPCFTPEGKIMLESADSLCLAPDGNGGIYHALKKSGSLDRMSSLGIEHLHVYGIDNILTRSADPLFLGYCISNSFQLGNKVVSRLNAAEKVGVTALHSFRDPITGTMEPNRLCIVEYSELPPECTGEDVSTGQLIYSAANICNHYFSLSFLLNQVYPHLSSSYHIANKKIPCYDLSSNSTVTPLTNNGIKLEMFIFDIFSLANSYGVFEVDREEEFAPVKNAPGAATDSPDTARELLSNQCLRWLQTAGVEIVEATDMNSDIDFQGSEGESLKKECEISPLLSYSGEGLEHLRGAKLSLPCYLRDFTVTNDLQF